MSAFANSSQGSDLSHVFPFMNNRDFVVPRPGRVLGEVTDDQSAASSNSSEVAVAHDTLTIAKTENGNADRASTDQTDDTTSAPSLPEGDSLSSESDASLALVKFVPPSPAKAAEAPENADAQSEPKPDESVAIDSAPATQVASTGHASAPRERTMKDLLQIMKARGASPGKVPPGLATTATEDQSRAAHREEQKMSIQPSEAAAAPAAKTDAAPEVASEADATFMPASGPLILANPAPIAESNSATEQRSAFTSSASTRQLGKQAQRFLDAQQHRPGPQRLADDMSVPSQLSTVPTQPADTSAFVNTRPTGRRGLHSLAPPGARSRNPAYMDESYASQRDTDIQAMLNEMMAKHTADLESRYKELEGKIGQLEQTKMELEKTNKTLDEKNTALETELSGAQITCADLSNQLSSMKDKLEASEALQATLRKKNAGLLRKFNAPHAPAEANNTPQATREESDAPSSMALSMYRPPAGFTRDTELSTDAMRPIITRVIRLQPQISGYSSNGSSNLVHRHQHLPRPHAFSRPSDGFFVSPKTGDKRPNVDLHQLAHLMGGVAASTISAGSSLLNRALVSRIAPATALSRAGPESNHLSARDAYEQGRRDALHEARLLAEQQPHHHSASCASSHGHDGHIEETIMHRSIPVLISV